MSKVDRELQDNAVLKLVRQRDLVFPLDIIHRLFRDDYALMVPKPRFMTVCEQVRNELQLIHGGDRFNLSSDEQLSVWSSRTVDMSPWFTEVNNPEMGRCVEITPAARIVHDTLMMGETEEKGVSGQAINALFDEIIGAAARIIGDNDVIIRRAEQEIEERRLLIDKLRLSGPTIVSDKDKQAFASNVARLMTDVNRIISVVPERLKIANRTAREIFYHSQASHGDVIKEMLDVIMHEIDSPGYGALESIAGLAVDDGTREELETAIQTIVATCGDMMTEEMRKQAHGFLSGVSQVSRQVISQHRASSDTIVGFVKSDAFQTRGAEMQALLRLTEIMRMFAPQTRMTKRALSGFGLRLHQVRAERHRVFDLRIASDLPSHRVDEVLAVDETAEANPEVVEMAKRAVRKAVHLDTDRMKSKVESHVIRSGSVPLSWILQKAPPQYGSEELSRYIQLALERMPSVFPEGWGLRIWLPTPDGDSREYIVSDPVFRSSRQDPETAKQEAALIRPRGKVLLTNGGLLETFTHQDTHT